MELVNRTKIFVQCYNVNCGRADGFLCLRLSLRVRMEGRKCLNIVGYFYFRVFQDIRGQLGTF